MEGKDFVMDIQIQTVGQKLKWGECFIALANCPSEILCQISLPYFYSVFQITGYFSLHITAEIKMI